jgi:DNA-binding CsgD family transcriptional regulator
MKLKKTRKPASGFSLTKREEEIADLLAEGLTAKQVGGRLRIASETVRSHTRSIYLKLRVRNKLELARKIIRMHRR